MYCCTLIYVHSTIAIILIGKRELVALLNLSSWCLVMVEWLFLAVSWGCLWVVILVFPDHTYLRFLIPVRSDTLAETDHKIISTAILFSSADSRRAVVSYKRKYVHELLVNHLVKLVHEKICGKVN